MGGDGVILFRPASPSSPRVRYHPTDRRPTDGNASRSHRPSKSRKRLTPLTRRYQHATLFTTSVTVTLSTSLHFIWSTEVPVQLVPLHINHPMIWVGAKWVRVSVFLLRHVQHSACKRTLRRLVHPSLKRVLPQAVARWGGF